jgi:hypothetical protein
MNNLSGRGASVLLPSFFGIILAFIINPPELKNSVTSLIYTEYNGCEKNSHALLSANEAVFKIPMGLSFSAIALYL